MNYTIQSDKKSLFEISNNKNLIFILYMWEHMKYLKYSWAVRNESNNKKSNNKK